ncbi:SCP2 sterol-binding domain-containing protein [Flindersiella endophytica]
MTMTVGELFDALPDRLNTKAAAGLKRTLQWCITDEDPGVWAFEIDDGQGRLIPGGVAEPDTTFTVSSEIWIAIAEGRQDAMRAFMTGKLKVEGDMMLALKVPELFETGPSPSTPDPKTR